MRTRPDAPPAPTLLDDVASAPRGGSRLGSALVGALVTAGVGAAVSYVTENGLPRWARRPTRWERLREALGGSAPVLVGGLGFAAAAGLVRWQLARLFTEEPDYVVEGHIGEVEIRRYAPRVVAETTIETGSFRDALGLGFRRLADYIFGENHAKVAHGARVVASIAPPSRPADDGEHIAMTTPVTTVKDGNGWKMAFHLPKDFSPETAPEPTDARIQVRREPERRIAALRFTGTFDHQRIEAAELDLLTRLADAGVAPVGQPSFAGYDGPSTLPFLRRNEAWVLLEDEPPPSTAHPTFGSGAHA